MTKPRLLATTPEAPAAGEGLVESNLPHGEIFLHPAGQPAQRIRLRWNAGEAPGPRALPAGQYRVTGYRRVQRDDDGVQWIWSTTSPGYRTLTVTAGTTIRLGVKETLTTRGRTFSINGTKRAGFSFVAEKRLGNTIYRDGARITIQWNALDAGGTVCAEGPMAYG